MRVHGKPKQKFTAASDVSLTNLASLEALNKDLEVPIGMDRFRPNVVVDGIGAYEEDYGGSGLTTEFRGAPWNRISDEIYREHGA